MPPLDQWCHVFKQLSPWTLAGFASAASAVVGWGYLRVLRALPWINSPVLAVGLLLLVLEPVVELKGERAGVPHLQMVTVAGLMALGAFQFTLGLAGRWFVRRDTGRELLRRELWDRYSEL